MTVLCPAGQAWLAALPATVDRAAVLAVLAPAVDAWHAAAGVAIVTDDYHPAHPSAPRKDLPEITAPVMSSRRT